jgi:hypothetical protein
MIATLPPPPIAAVVTVYRGETLSGIASAHGVSLASIEAANPQVTDPNSIAVGQRLDVPTASPSSLPVAPTHTVPVTGEGTPPPSAGNVQPTLGQAGGTEAVGYAPVPVGNATMWACIERAESSDNPRSVNQLPGGSGGGLFGDLESTWADYDGYPEPYDAPVSVQVTFNAQLYREDGYQPWDDPCTGRNGA